METKTAAYGLYLESGPRHGKTMVHVLDLLGCVANGPTTEAALDATPAAVRAFLRFLQRCGEQADPDAPFETPVIEHVTEGLWLGNGSPYVTYDPDLAPVSAEEVEVFARRFVWFREALASWAEGRSEADLDATPAGGGRGGRAVLLHVLVVPGACLSTALAGVTGFSRIQTLVERGEMPLPVALRRVATLAVDRLGAASPEERAAIRNGPRELRTLRKAVRRMLEHDWEHLVELSRRPGGPEF